MRIQSLSPHIANQIAAGEVIERPASVVKELLENALDAGATRIQIDIGFGGLTQIRVSDNGMGIHADDMHLAIAAHATSKISQLTDLYRLTTMGFRGEALASIASVSRLSLHSKSAEQAHGMLLSVDESGAVLRSCPRTQGTTVDVCDLFFNAPVRKTFLKSERVEYLAIELVVKQFALSTPSMAISLKHNGKLMLQLPTGDDELGRLRRVKKLFGQAFLNDAAYVEESYEYLALCGWVSQREYQRSQRDKQWVYLNQRFIKDKLIQQTMTQVYQNIIHPGRYPSYLLYLNVDPKQVDVNVHPTKYEVRFQEPRLVQAMLLSALNKQLQTVVPPVEKIAKAPTVDRIASSTQPHAVHREYIDWKIMNEHFALLFDAHQRYHLVDVRELHQQYLRMQIQSNPAPLPERPLLVPVRCSISDGQLVYAHRDQLAQLGIHFDDIASDVIGVRTLPRCLPMLDIEAFFTRLTQKSTWTLDALKQLAIDCQSFNAYNINPLELEELLQFFKQQEQALPLTRQCSLSLDKEACAKIFQECVLT